MVGTPQSGPGVSTVQLRLMTLGARLTPHRAGGGGRTPTTGEAQVGTHTCVSTLLGTSQPSCPWIMNRPREQLPGATQALPMTPGLPRWQDQKGCGQSANSSKRAVSSSLFTEVPPRMTAGNRLRTGKDGAHWTKQKHTNAAVSIYNSDCQSKLGFRTGRSQGLGHLLASLRQLAHPTAGGGPAPRNTLRAQGRHRS